MINKETFCSLPFSSVFLGADGGIKPCCSSGAILGDINKTPIDQIIYGPIATEIRQSIVNGQWHESCGQCKKLEANNTRTERTGVLHEMPEFADVTENTFRFNRLDARWSNTCNLACTYCYEYFSSQWAAIKGIKINSNKDFAEEAIFKLISDRTTTEPMRNINLLGGEPLLQKQNLRLVDTLPDSNYYILTNLSVDIPNNAIVKKLLAAKSVNWGISFETVGDKFEYVRRNAKWDRLVSNLKYLKANYPKSMNAHPMYCSYSAFNLVEFYDFIIGSSLFNGVYWCAIQNIPGLDVYTLPNSLKQKAIDEIDRCCNKYPGAPGIDALLNIKHGLTESMQVEHRVETPAEFIEWIRVLEQQHMPNYRHTFKDLWPDVAAELCNFK